MYPISVIFFALCCVMDQQIELVAGQQLSLANGVLEKRMKKKYIKYLLRNGCE